MDEGKWQEWLEFLYERLPTDFIPFDDFLRSLPSQGGWGAKRGRVLHGLTALIKHGKAKRIYRYPSCHGHQDFVVLYKRT